MKDEKLPNPGILEIVKIVLQLYAQRSIERQDIAELESILKSMVSRLPDTCQYKH